MAKGFIGATSYKAYLGATKMKAGYIGATRVYSAGSTVTYVVDNGVSYTEEVDSGASCLSPKSFAPTKSGWTFVGWRQDKTASGSVLSDLTMGDSPITLYAVFRQTVTVTYYNGSTTASAKTEYRYYNTGNVANPSFTLPQAAMSGWNARGWSTSSAGNGGVSYNNGVAFTRDSNVTLYGMYYQTITLTYYNGSATAASTSGTRYYNPGSGGVVNPTFTLTPASLSDWTFRGWATSSAAAAGITYSSISNTAFGASITVYAAYSQTITLSYNGNGATSGSTAAQTGTRYWNTGNVSNPSFILQSNGFNKSNYSFSKWALGSTSGTQYAVGAAITLSANTTMYALWLASSLTVFSRSIFYEAPEINNRSYVTFSGGFSSSILLVGNVTDPGTGTININLGQYRKATITFYIWGNDMDEKSGRYGSVTFDGATSGNGIYYARANSSPSGTLVMDNSGAISAYATCYNSRFIITMSITSIVLTA